MSRKRKQQPIKKADEPKPRGFIPRPCSQCTAIRPANTSYSRVYSKHGLIRYCKCDFCGNTWSQYFDNVARCIAIADATESQNDDMPLLSNHGILGGVISTDRSSD